MLFAFYYIAFVFLVGQGFTAYAIAQLSVEAIALDSTFVPHTTKRNYFAVSDGTVLHRAAHNAIIARHCTPLHKRLLWLHKLPLVHTRHNAHPEFFLIGQLGRKQSKCIPLYGAETTPISIHDIKPPRKILLMVEPTPFTWISGYATRYKEFLNFLSRQNDTVLILTTDTSRKRPTRAYGFRIVYTHGFPIPFYKKEGYTLSADVPQFKGWALIRRFKPDILHVSSPGLLVLTATFLYARIFRVPLVLAYHTHLPAYASKYFKFFPDEVFQGLRACMRHMHRLGIEKLVWLLIKCIHKHADLTLVTSPQLQEEMQKWGIRRVCVWEKGIDTEKFHPRMKDASMRVRLTNGVPEAPLLLSVGRLSVEKDLKLLREVLKQIPDARLAFVGSGPIEEELKLEFKGTNTVFMGTLEGNELSQAFASADIFCMPSTTETLGFVVLEAMASGIPVVGSNSGGIPNLIKNSATGYLVEPLNASLFAEKVRKLIDHTDLRHRMGRAAREEAEQWSWAQSMSHLRNYQYRIAIKTFLERSSKTSWIAQFLY